MTFNYELVNKIVEAIFPLPEKFGSIDDQTSDYNDDPVYFDEIYDAIIQIDKDIQIDYGATKMVISSPNFGGVVIKIPFNGYFIRYDEEEDLTWYDFYNAESSDSSDYCLAEYEKYQQLKKRKLHCFVTKTILFKIMYGVRVFLQEYVIPENDDYELHTPSLKSLKLADKWRKENKFYIDSEWVANCVDKYGEYKTEKFLTYCNTVDYSILADAHCGNYGYRLNGTPCILDFSNFLD